MSNKTQILPKEKLLLKIFIKFLKNKHIVHSYFFNFSNSPIGQLSFSYFISKICNVSFGAQLVYSAFAWYKTKEGNDFWSDIEDEWIVIWEKTKKWRNKRYN